AVISTLTIALSSPVATRQVRIVFLAWLAAVLYSNTTPGTLAAVLSVTRLPLIPLATCYSLGGMSHISWHGLGAVLMDGVYVVGLTLVAEFWMRRRDLLLQ